MKHDLCVACSDICNFSCIYCKHKVMENFEPSSLKKNPISVDDFCAVLNSISKIVQPYSVNLTGGEPFLNLELNKIVKTLRPLCRRLEVTTNGSIPLQEKWLDMNGQFDRVKLSLDTLNQESFTNITNFHDNGIIDKIKHNISFLKKQGENIAINVVLLKSYLKELYTVLDFAVQEGIKVQLFEFIYKEDKKEVWKREYIRVEELIAEIEEKYGRAIIEETIGGRFYKIPYNNGYIRFKTVSSITRRNSQCERCSYYCQEGLFFLRVSRNGWVTPCSSINKDDGVHITKDMDLTTVKEKISPFLNILDSSYLDDGSFEKFIQRNRLSDSL